MPYFYIITTACCGLLISYYALFSTTAVNDSESGVEAKNSDLRMLDLYESLSYLYQTGLFSDLTIVTDDEFKVHKSILSARSEVFRQLLESQRDLDKITLQGISKKAVRQMLLFIYTGQTKDLCFEVAIELFSVADTYKLELLKKLCSDILVENLKLDNLIEFLSLSSEYYDETLRKAAVDFIVDNTVAVRQQSKWLEFIQAHPKLVDEVIGSLASKK